MQPESLIRVTVLPLEGYRAEQTAKAAPGLKAPLLLDPSS